MTEAAVPAVTDWLAGVTVRLPLAVPSSAQPNVGTVSVPLCPAPTPNSTTYRSYEPGSVTRIVSSADPPALWPTRSDVPAW